MKDICERTEQHRPFKNAKECVEELKKHTPAGYVKIKNDRFDSRYSSILSVTDEGIVLGVVIGYMSFGTAINNIVFADGSFFGVKE